MSRHERGQTAVFFVLVLTGLLVLTAVAVEIGRIVYARGEVGKAADAAALAGAARLDVPFYRETGGLRFLPDTWSTAQWYASHNSSFLSRRNIPVTVTGIQIDPATQRVSVTVSADLSSLMPGVLPFDGRYAVTGIAQARIR